MGGNAFHDAYMEKTDDCPHGFYRQGPPSSAANGLLRARRQRACQAHDARFVGTLYGAVMCMFCYLHGHSSVKCRVKAPGCYNHGPELKQHKGTRLAVRTLTRCSLASAWR